MNRSRTVQRVILLICIIATVGLQSLVAVAQPATPIADAAVDLATVPVPPADLPEPGFQLVQAGWLSLDGLTATIAGEEPPATSPFAEVEGDFTGGYSQVLALLSDRADPFSEPLSGAATYVLQFTSDDSATTAAANLVDLIGLDEPEPIDGVDVWQGTTVTSGIVVHNSFVVVFNYTFDEQRFSTRQNTDWTPEAVAGVVNQTTTRIDDAIERAADGKAGLSTAGLLFTGDVAIDALPWTYFPVTQHYRVLNGDVLPYGGELDTDLVVPDGMETYFISRQQIGDDGFDHMIDISLAEFDSAANAEAFAADPPPIQFPPTWTFEPDYGEPTEVEPGLWLQTVRIDGDALRATGLRTIRVADTSVQVVQWLGSDQALTSKEGMLELTSSQSACLDALPSPCQPLALDQFPAPYNATSAAEGDYPNIGTPEPRAGGDAILASLAYGWEVTLPEEDAWQITDVQFIDGEYYQLQSGRSLLTIESVINRAPSPQDCLLDEVAMLEEFEERAAITLGSDDANERKAGSEQGHAWGVYTVEPLQEERADQEYTIRIDCYTLVPGEVSLIITHTAPRDLWTEERARGERFRDALELPDSSTVAIATTPSAGDRWAFGRNPAMGTIVRIWIPLAA